MLGVGWFYSRRAETTEDYLLGGRTMKPWAVGLSLLATLASTISCLAMPGGMIKNGRMRLTEIVAQPFNVRIVGWFFIPFIMKLQIINAYEILERRLGVSVRLLGSTFFLSLRLLWMTTIICARRAKCGCRYCGSIPLGDFKTWTAREMRRQLAQETRKDTLKLLEQAAPTGQRPQGFKVWRTAFIQRRSRAMR